MPDPRAAHAYDELEALDFMGAAKAISGYHYRFAVPAQHVIFHASLVSMRFGKSSFVLLSGQGACGP